MWGRRSDETSTLEHRRHLSSGSCCSPARWPFRVAAVPALVRFPLDVNQTAHYTGTSITYIDQSTLLPLATPKREPLTSTAT